VFSSDTPGDRRKDAPNARQPVEASTQALADFVEG